MNEHDTRPEPTETGGPGLHPALAAAMQTERERPAEAAQPELRTPEPTTHEERSRLATHADPSTAAAASSKSVESASGPRASVAWVRPTDLIAQGTARVAAVGIDLQAELTRRLRAATGDAARRGGRAVSDRARRLPDLARQNLRRAPRREAAERSGVGPR